MHNGSGRVRLLTLIFLHGLLVVGSSSSIVIAADIPSSSPPTGSDPIASLQRRLDQREVQLEYATPWGYLLSVLKQLQVPLSSQTLVFSRTSFQQFLISPATPRALYFNDTVYVGWVPGGDVLEVSAVDPERGAMFYFLNQKKAATPQFIQREECLQCHESPRTLGIPGHLGRSVFPDSDGLPQLQAGSYQTDHTSPLKERWGGWYVTGTHGSQRHMGNVWVIDKDKPDQLNSEAGANVTSLQSYFQVSTYPRPDSDLVALMVLEHQTRLHNLLAKASIESRVALEQQTAVNRALGEPVGQWSESTRRRIHSQVDTLLKYLLFTEEAQLSEAVTGTSSFQNEFPKTGPRDRLGRSLRDFDLKHRMFRYPCSFLIYSDAFEAMPTPAKDYFYLRLWKVLTGEDKSQEFASLSQEDRKNILEILRDIKPGLPEYWTASR